MSNTRKLRKPDAPVLLGRGSYAIYQAPNGDGVIAYRPEGQPEDSHQVVPARFWTVALKILRGETADLNPAQLMKMMLGGKGGA